MGWRRCGHNTIHGGDGGFIDFWGEWGEWKEGRMGEKEEGGLKGIPDDGELGLILVTINKLRS